MIDDAKRAAEIAACEHELTWGKHEPECAKCGVRLKDSDPGYAELEAKFMERIINGFPSLRINK